MTPLHLEILLWYHTRADRMENHDEPAVTEYRQQLLKDGILRAENRYPYGYALTRKGEVWLDAMLSTPYPVQQWVMPT